MMAELSPSGAVQETARLVSEAALTVGLASRPGTSATSVTVTCTVTLSEAPAGSVTVAVNS